MEDPNDFYYHVTYFANLDSIAEEGITPGNAPAIGTSQYDEHRKGNIFLTTAPGVIFWQSKSEEWAYSTSDDWYEEGLIPVVLRIPASEELNEELEEDEPGTRDAAADAWVLKGSIDPEDIEVYYDGEWLPIEDWDEIDIDSTVDFVEDSEEDDPEYEGYYEMKSDDENPLYVDFHNRF
jgi:hypothetical protein